MLKLFTRSLTVAFAVSFVVILFAVAPAQAAPANPNYFPITQPDGTSFLARQWGDEWNHGFETADGYSIIQDSGSGYWVYASTAETGSLAPATVNGNLLIVGRDQPVGLKTGVRPAEMRANPNENLGSQKSPLNQNSGTQKVLVILAQFGDRPGTYPAADFGAKFFAATASVKSFYEQASRGAFSISPAEETYGTANDGVIGWITVGANHLCPASGSCDYNFNYELIAKNAIVAANSYIDYGSFDANADGYLSTSELHIVVIVAGYEESYSSAYPAVWAHDWNLDVVTAPVLDKVTVSSGAHGGGYFEIGEIHGNHAATIGTMAHEFGHDISWPDLYDTSGATEGVGEWSIMGSGSWNYVSGDYGSSPAFPDAWLKWYQGWQTPVKIIGTSNALTINPIETTGDSYLLGANPRGVDWNFGVQYGVGEYFLVENRQLINYDAGLPGCGLLIWHIDESVASSNAANQGAHPLVFLEQADGLNHLMLGANRGDGGDSFPGILNKTSFNDLTSPNSKLYNIAGSGVSVTSILSTPAACTQATPATITANLAAPGIGIGPNVFIPAIKTPPSQGIYGVVTDHGAALPNVQVDLYLYSGAWSKVASTLTGTDGMYSFQNQPSLAAGQKYFAEFANTEKVSTRLSFWDTKLLTTYTMREEVTIGSFDVADVVLVSPLPGAVSPLPVAFNWTKRANSPTDSHKLEFYTASSFAFAYESSPLGYVSTFSLTSLPPSLAFGTQYCWFLEVGSPDGGTGWSYWCNYLTFQAPGSPSLRVPLRSVLPRHLNKPAFETYQ